MSDFQRKLFQDRLAKVEAQMGFDADNEESEDSVGELAPLPKFKRAPRAPPVPRKSLADLDAEYKAKLPNWDQYFDTNDIYREPASGYCFQTYYKEPKLEEDVVADVPNNPVVFIGHHGAGSTGLTFAKLADSVARQSTLQKYETAPGLFTFDMRGHADTALLNDDEAANADLSIGQICSDFVFVLEQFVKRHFSQGQKPDLFLIGHSLGGAVLTKLVWEQQQARKQGQMGPFPEEIASLIKGLVMVDIVEDTAVEALGSMKSYLRGVPSQFRTLKDAVDWHTQSGLLNNSKSAELSVPALVHKVGNGYQWVTDLAKSSRYWDDWFTGLSLHFTQITNAISKMLILVNNDYLDKNLMIGQMQGKYQLLVFHNQQLQAKNTLTTATHLVNSQDATSLGHFVHEDIPDRVAISLLEFVERNDCDALKRNLPANDPKAAQMELLSKLNAKWGVKK